MNKQTLALALGEDVPEGSDEELEEASEGSGEEEGSSLADDLELAFDPASDATTREEAFRRAVKAAMR